MNLLRIIAAAFLLLASPAVAQWQTPAHTVPTGQGAGATGFGFVGPGAAGVPFLGGGTLTDPAFGPLNLAGSGTITGKLPLANNCPGTTGASSTTFLAGDCTWKNSGAPISPDAFGAVCDGTTDDAVPLQNWLNALRDGGIGAFTTMQANVGCATTAPLLLQASTNTGPVQGPRFLGSIKIVGLPGLGGTATGTGSGTNLTLSAVTGKIHVGDTVTGTGINANTHVLSQISGTPNGAGVYQTDFATTGIASLVVVTSDVLRIWNPTAITTSQNFYYPNFDTLILSAASGSALANCLSIRGYWGSISKIIASVPGQFGCHGGDLVQFPNYIGPGSIPDEYESNPSLGDLTCVSCSGYVLNNLIGIGATPRTGNVRGTTGTVINTGLGAIFATGSEAISGAVAYTGQGWGITINQPPAGGGAIVTTPHEVFMQGAGDIDCSQNGVWVAAMEMGTITGHRMNTEAANICGAGFPQWPITAYKIGGGGGRVLGSQINPYITIRPGFVWASTTLFDFSNDANINNVIINSVISDQTGTLAAQAFGTIYKNINANAGLRIIQNGFVVYDTLQMTTFAGLPPCVFGLSGARRTVSDSNTVVFRAVIAGGGGNQVQAACIANQWIVD